MTNDELLHKWINETISEEELKRFKRRPEFKELSAIYRLTENLGAPSLDENAMLAEIINKKKANRSIGSSSQAPPSVKKEAKVISFGRWFQYGIAASVLIVASWWFLIRESTIETAETIHTTLAQESIEALLPDESYFYLNAESTLKLVEENWSNNRRLVLDGEAFFDVKEGSDFIVETKNGSIKVVGTQFNVRSRNQQLEVQCQEGKVNVLTLAGKLLKKLSEKDAIRVKNSAIVEDWKLSNTEPPGWTNGSSSFRNVPLSTVLEELERQFNVQINAKKIDISEKGTYHFPHESLDLALKTAFGSLNIQYEIKGDKVILNK